jgi:flagellar capping protein FliD
MNGQDLTKMKTKLEPFVKTYNKLWHTKKPVTANNEKNMNNALETVLGTIPNFSKGLFTALEKRNVNELKSALLTSTKNLNKNIEKITENVKYTTKESNFDHEEFAHALNSWIYLILIRGELTTLKN